MEVTLIDILKTVALAWAAWISATTIRNSLALKSVSIENKGIKDDLLQAINHMDKSSEDMKESFKEMRAEVKNDINDLSNRFDTFISTEINTLKILTGNK